MFLSETWHPQLDLIRAEAGGFLKRRSFKQQDPICSLAGAQPALRQSVGVDWNLVGLGFGAFLFGASCELHLRWQQFDG
jgi:hypothetical protein